MHWLQMAGQQLTEYLSWRPSGINPIFSHAPLFSSSDVRLSSVPGALGCLKDHKGERRATESRQTLSWSAQALLTQHTTHNTQHTSPHTRVTAWVWVRLLVIDWIKNTCSKIWILSGFFKIKQKDYKTTKYSSFTDGEFN